MHDDELESVAAEAYNLTDVACERLSYEIKSRKLPIELNLTAPPSDEELEALPPSDDGFVPEDDELIIVEWVESMEQLLRIKHVLDEAQIECFLGEEKVRDPKQLQSGFEGGLVMRVWRAAADRTYRLLKAAIPGYGSESTEPVPDADIRCPKCKSDGVIFEEVDASSTGDKETGTSKYCWTCDDCGHEWEDDGVVRD